MAYQANAKAILISIGKEILRGLTADGDAHFLARKLTSLGYEIERIVVVDDDPKAIGAEIRDALGRKAKLIFTTGGLGPTFDDRTVASVAKALKRKLVVTPESLDMVKLYYKEMAKSGVVKSAKLNGPRKKMAKIPKGATPLRNRKGAAPGAWILEGGTSIFCLPGVPIEMKSIFQHEILPLVFSRHQEIAMDVPVATKDESLLALRLRRVMKKLPGVYAKSRVHGAKGKIRIVVSLHGPSQRKVQRAARMLRGY